MKDNKQKYIRWAIDELLRGKYDEAIRSIRWAKEEEEASAHLVRDEVKENENDIKGSIPN